MVQWKGRRESDNVEDRRGEDGGGGFQIPGGGGIQIPIPMGRRGGGIGIFGMLILLGLALLFGINPLDILTGGGGGQQFPMPRVDPQGKQLPKIELPDMPWQKKREAGGATAPTGNEIKPVDDDGSFIKVMLADTEDVWTKMFESVGRRYEAPTLVMFSNGTQTACGPGMSAMGPFYCPLDEKVYIDLNFYQELSRRFGAPGDFAQAYVIAHEVGHHVQKQLGIADQVQAYKERVSQVDGNAAQVRMELQADCYAGVWANQTQNAKGFLEKGDVEEGLNAANAIGDDALQKKMQGRVVPDAFTHGTSEQRARWFRIGLETGDPRQCDTFNTEEL